MVSPTYFNLNNIYNHLEKATAPHSSILAWKIPWTEEPGRLQSMGSAKSQTRLSDFTFTFHFHALEKEWQPTPVFLPGESQGWRSLVGCHLQGRTELNKTEATQQQQQQHIIIYLVIAGSFLKAQDFFFFKIGPRSRSPTILEMSPQLIRKKLECVDINQYIR